MTVCWHWAEVCPARAFHLHYTQVLVLIHTYGTCLMDNHLSWLELELVKSKL